MEEERTVTGAYLDVLYDNLTSGQFEWSIYLAARHLGKRSGVARTDTVLKRVKFYNYKILELKT